MTITLIRHAEVLAKDDKKLYASEIPKWVEHYNIAPVDSTLPSLKVTEKINNANMVVASTLQRTHDSLSLLDVKAEIKDAVFNEAEVPLGKIPYIKLYAKHWLVVLRIMQFLGLLKDNTSLKSSKARANKATNTLVALAKDHEHIALIGHGGLNWFIGKALVSSGWEQVEAEGGSDNWGYKVFQS